MISPQSSLPIYLLLFIFLFSALGSEQQSSREIQEDIETRNVELQSLRNEIKELEEKLISKNREAISTTQILLDLENKITLTEKLIRSLNKEEQYISGLIQEAENQISNMETQLKKLKNQLTQRLQHLYIHGRPSVLETILLAENWNNAIYRIKYLEILSEYEKKLRGKLNQTLADLANEKAKLVIELNRKTSLRDEKKRESANLDRDKNKRENILSQIKQDKGQLERQRIEKEQMIAEMEALINKLYSDKKAMKRREEELAKIRADQNRPTTGNFAKMKGKLSWPVRGRIISRYGSFRNPNTGTITVNVGIDIRAQAGVPVVSVLDGVVSTITYIRGHGNVVIIDHGGGFSTVYAHIDEIHVHENEYVQSGNSFAKIAVPEQNTAPKLHFEVWGNQKKQDPEIWLTRN